MKNPFLIGKRIYLRPLEPEDAPILQPWVNDPEVTRFLLMYRPHTLADEKEFVERVRGSRTDLILGIARRRDDRLIGSTGLHGIDGKNRTATFGIVIGDKRAWGRGHGTEATSLIVDHGFETLNLHRVALQVVEFNERGIRAYEKVGFVREGVLRSDIYLEGRYWDVLCMAILREEWEARRRSRRPSPAPRPRAAAVPRGARRKRR